MSKMKLSHNLTDLELEHTLEKALTNLRPWTEPNRDLPDYLANQVKDEANTTFEKVVKNMLDEIQMVIHPK
ncbi:hypothetical protein D3C74_50610 [compost metagenome]